MTIFFVSWAGKSYEIFIYTTETELNTFYPFVSYATKCRLNCVSYTPCFIIFHCLFNVLRLLRPGFLCYNFSILYQVKVIFREDKVITYKQK